MGRRISSMHGLCHHYAQTRYQELIGWKAPKVGRPLTKYLKPEQRIKDTQINYVLNRTGLINFFENLN